MDKTAEQDRRYKRKKREKKIGEKQKEETAQPTKNGRKRVTKGE